MKKFLQNIVKLKTISTIKDFRFGLHMDLYLEFDDSGQLSTKIYDFFYHNAHLLCIFIYLKHIDYNKMSKYIQKVEKCSFLITRSVKVHLYLLNPSKVKQNMY
jgi:hypothetical protein